MINLSLRFKNHCKKEGMEYTGLNFLIWFAENRPVLVNNTNLEQDNITVIPYPDVQVKDKELLEDIYKELDRHGIYRTLKNGDSIGLGNGYSASIYNTGLYVIEAIYIYNEIDALFSFTDKDADMEKLSKVVDSIVLGRIDTAVKDKDFEYLIDSVEFAYENLDKTTVSEGLKKSNLGSSEDVLATFNSWGIELEPMLNAVNHFEHLASMAN